MAIKLEDKENASAPNSTYPYGNIEDNTGSNNGTPVNKAVYADFHQFFAKLLDVAEGTTFLTGNDLPENDDNGFQYYTSLLMSARIANQSLLSYITTALIGDYYDATKPYALYKLSDDGAAIDVGYLFWNGKIYTCGGLNYGVIVNDLQFNITSETALTITDSAAPGEFQYSDIIFINTRDSFEPTLTTTGGGTFTAVSKQINYKIEKGILVINCILASVEITGTPTSLEISIPAVKTIGNRQSYSVCFFDNGANELIKNVIFPSSSMSEKIGIFDRSGAFSAFAGGNISFQIILTF